MFLLCFSFAASVFTLIEFAQENAMITSLALNKTLILIATLCKNQCKLQHNLSEVSSSIFWSLLLPGDHSVRTDVIFVSVRERAGMLRAFLLFHTTCEDSTLARTTSICAHICSTLMNLFTCAENPLSRLQACDPCACLQYPSHNALHFHFQNNVLWQRDKQRTNYMCSRFSDY